MTLYLLNQQDPCNTRAHIAQVIQPTETSTSFQKPRGPFNTPSGFPKFAPVEKLRDRKFVQDDCMYFKVKVDPCNTRAHITQAFQPTETSTSFQKPRRPFSSPSGFPKFAPVEKLRDRNFVQDDCMYFKVKVDMTGVKDLDYPAN